MVEAANLGLWTKYLPPISMLQVETKYIQENEMKILRDYCQRVSKKFGSHIFTFGLESVAIK